MADRPPYPDSNDDTSVGPDRGSTTDTPRWVYVFGLIAIVLGLLFAILHFTSGGLRHTTTPRASQLPGAGDAQVVSMVLREFEFEPRPLKVKAGVVRFHLMNRGRVDHDFTIPQLQGHGAHEQHLVKPGKGKMIELKLPPGRYRAICNIPGHQEAAWR